MNAASITIGGTLVIPTGAASGYVLTSDTNGNASWGAPPEDLTVGSSVISGGTTGSVLFVGSGGTLQQDNANFFWNDTNNRLGLGTSAPTVTLHVVGSSTIVRTDATTSLVVQNIASGTSQHVAEFRTTSGVRLASIQKVNSNGGWIDFNTSLGSVGIGSGGAGTNAWLAYAGANGEWFSDSLEGDVCYRNSRLLFGPSSGDSLMQVSSSGISINPSAINQKALVVTGLSGQTSNIMEVQTSSGVVSYFGPQGFLKLGGNSWAPQAALDVEGGVSLKRRVVSTTPTTLASNDYLIAVTGPSSARVVNLPAASSVANGQSFMISDEAGNAGTYNITINRAGSDTIDGQTSYVISSNYGVVRFYSNGSNTWFVTQAGNGAQGNQGVAGSNGTQGATGPQGVTGAGTQGNQGVAGANGTQGTQGRQGATGAGTQGVAGATGPQGAIGPQGATGAGTQGNQGVAGANGVQGAPGPQGATGAGTQGVAGATGPQGAIGPQGATGAGTQGVAGAAGPQGAIGPQGATGAGTQGNQGVAGSAGTQGTQGRQGATGAGTQGNQGVAGSAGPQGTTGAGTQGVQGIAGSTGPQGATGPQGSTGAGTQGNQGVSGSNGTQGATGPQGSVGAQGASGPQGTAGTNGTQGTQGRQGASGANGLQGATGPQGTAGANGLQGAAGTNGAQGATGPQGTQGRQGSAGTNGLQGATGPQGSSGTNGLQGASGPQGHQGVAGTGTQGNQGNTGPQGGSGALSIGATTIGSGTTGSVLFVGNSTFLQQDNSNLFWDDSNNRLGIGTNSPQNTLDVQGGLRLKRTAVTLTPYTIQATDHIIGVTGPSSARVLNLPSAASSAAGLCYVISDEAGNAGTYNITINRAGSDTIEGQTSYVIQDNYGSVKLYSNGSNQWFTTDHMNGVSLAPANITRNIVNPTGNYDALVVRGHSSMSNTSDYLRFENSSSATHTEFPYNSSGGQINLVNTAEANKTMKIRPSLYADTDGYDIHIDGGGIRVGSMNDSSQATGAIVQLFPNTSSSWPGSCTLDCGNNSNSMLLLRSGSSTSGWGDERLKIQHNSGATLTNHAGGSVALKVATEATQTANMVEILNSGSTVMDCFGPQGYLGVGTNAPVASADIRSLGTTNPTMTVRAASVGSSDIFQALDGAGTTKHDHIGNDGRLYIKTPNSAPSDVNLQASQITFYLDQASNQLRVRVKYADGTTLRTGTISLV